MLQVEEQEQTTEQLKPNLYEQESIILWNEAEGTAEIYTASPRVRSRLTKAGLKPYQEDEHGAYFIIPRKAVRVKVGKKQVYVAGTASGVPVAQDNTAKPKGS